jgi:YggT family protein
VNIAVELVYLTVVIFWILLLVRFVIGYARTFARGWSPHGVTAVVVEVVFTVTDPPLKLLRRVIKPFRIGNMIWDFSLLLLIVALWFARTYLRSRFMLSGAM